MLVRKQKVKKLDITEGNQARQISLAIGNQAMCQNQNTYSVTRSPMQRILFTDVDVNKVWATDNMTTWWKMACERNFQNARENVSDPLTYIFSLRDIVLGQQPSNLAPEAKIRLDDGDRVRFAAHGSISGKISTKDGLIKPGDALRDVTNLVETSDGSPLPHDREHVGFEFCHMLADPVVDTILSPDPTKPLSSQLGRGSVLNPPGRILFFNETNCIKYIQNYPGKHDWDWIITDRLTWQPVSCVVDSNHVSIFSDYVRSKGETNNLSDVLDALYVEIGNSFDHIGRILEVANDDAKSAGTPLLNGSLPDPWT